LTSAVRACLLLVIVACASAPALPRRAATDEVVLRRLDGGTFTLRELRGRVVLVDFWATWCEPCKEALPFYAELQRELGAMGFTVAAVSVDSDDAKVNGFLGRSPLPVMVLRDPDGVVAERLDVRTMPTTFLLDRTGEVKFRYQGFNADERAAIRQRVLGVVQAPTASR
jgi:thiol-disulfide isomerase/thioredoxin